MVTDLCLFPQQGLRSAEAGGLSLADQWPQSKADLDIEKICMATNPIRVLFLIDSFQMGGAERVTAAILPYLDRSRIEPLVCTLRTRGDSPLAQKLGNVPRFDLGAGRMLDPFAFRRLLRLLRMQKIDLIHAQLQDATVFGVAANKLTGIPVVVTRHIIADDIRTTRKRLRNYVEGMSVRTGVERVITVSNATRDHYAKQMRLPLTRFQTIYNGIDLDNFAQAADKRAERTVLGLPPQGPLVTMVGVMRPGKGHTVAIEAARHLPDAHFVFVGDGEPDFRAELEAQAAKLRDHVHFLGQRMDVPHILGVSDMLILPSDSEALPTVLIEAGAASLPVVATSVGGVPEIVDNDITGILIRPQDPLALANAIKRLIQNPVLAREMGRCAYERVRRQFTLEAQTAALTEIYELVTVEKRKQSA